MFTYTLWGKDERLAATERELWLVGVRSVAKKLESHSPLEFANEFIGRELGSAIGIPVIRGERIFRDNAPWWCSFKFNSAAPEQLPSKIDAAAAVKACPGTAAGIVLFDVWICNQDRHPKNLGFDDQLPQLVAIDHGSALFGNSKASESLKNRAGKFYFESHCLVPHIEQLDYFVEWFWRIVEIPNQHIRRILSGAVDLGLPQNCVELGTEFLVNRRLELITMLDENRDKFKQSLNFHEDFKSLVQFCGDFSGALHREADWWLS